MIEWMLAAAMIALVLVLSLLLALIIAYRQQARQYAKEREVAQSLRGDLKDARREWRKRELSAFTRGREEAERQYTEFMQAQDVMWVGPKVERQFVEVQRSEHFNGVGYGHRSRLTPDSTTANVVRFVCKVKVMVIDKTVVKFPTWELE